MACLPACLPQFFSPPPLCVAATVPGFGQSDLQQRCTLNPFAAEM